MNKKNPAFTLVELIIAITVFSIFIAFGMTSFSVFHRVQQDSATSRDVMFQIDDAMNIITEAVKENKIDYGYYDCADSSISTITLSPAEFANSLTTSVVRAASCKTDTIEPNTLVLISHDGNNRIVFKYSDESLTMQEFEKDSSDEWNETSDALELHSDSVKVTSVDFRIFPNVDPYDSANNDVELFYQPNVKVKMTFETPGQARETISLDFETTITSRVYQ